MKKILIMSATVLILWVIIPVKVQAMSCNVEYVRAHIFDFVRSSEENAAHLAELASEPIEIPSLESQQKVLETTESTELIEPENLDELSELAEPAEPSKIVGTEDFLPEEVSLEESGADYISTEEEPLLEETSAGETEEMEELDISNCKKLGSFRVTYYCCEKRRHICGTGSGITATGTEVTPYRSAAVDPKLIPLGSKILIDFGDGILHNYIAEDTGSKVKGHHIDLAVETHEEALAETRLRATIYLQKKTKTPLTERGCLLINLNPLACGFVFLFCDRHKKW